MPIADSQYRPTLAAQENRVTINININYQVIKAGLKTRTISMCIYIELRYDMFLPVKVDHVHGVERIRCISCDVTGNIAIF